MAIKGQVLLKAALLFSAGARLSSCVYNVGLGYACDPYGGYDGYYNCDFRQGFSDILAVVCLAIITIPATASFYLTPSDAAIP